MTPPTTGSARRLRAAALAAEAARFGAVGGLAFVVDVSVFNLLRVGAQAGPLTSKVGSVVVASTVAYLANRHWTYRDRARTGLRREYLLFVALNGVGLLIGLGCLALSHYVLDLTSPLADNVSGNGVGLVLGTLFRFWAYRRFVFLELSLLPAGPAQSQVATPASPARR